MCSISFNDGSMSWTQCCSMCQINEGQVGSGLCKKCYHKDYESKNKEKRKAQHKLRYETIPGYKEKIIEKQAKYAKANREKINARAVLLSRQPGPRFSKSKIKSKAKGVEWKLTKQTYFALIKMECHYCNGYFQLQKDQCGIGLDRIDNKRGYEPGNVISACGTCNTTRMANWTVEETKVMIAAVINYRKLNHIDTVQSIELDIKGPEMPTGVLPIENKAPVGNYNWQSIPKYTGETAAQNQRTDINSYYGINTSPIFNNSLQQAEYEKHNKK